MDRVNYTNAAANSCIVATIANKDIASTISIQMVAQSLVGSITDQVYQKSASTEMSNIFSAFSSKRMENESGNYLPTFIEPSGGLERYNVTRIEPVNYSKPDGKDFIVFCSPKNYLQADFYNFGIVGTVNQFTDSGTYRDYDDDVINRKTYDLEDDQLRGIALKMPLMAAGPCYTMAGRPAPSIYDEHIVYDSGIIAKENSNKSGDIVDVELWKNTFSENAGKKPRLWPTGPVDLRWDRYRGVFSASPIIVQGYLAEELPPPSGHTTGLNFTSGEMIIFDGQYNNWKKVQPEQRALLINRSVGLTAQSGTYCVAQWMPNGEFRPLWLDCAPDPSGAYAKEKGKVFWPHTSGEVVEE